MIERLLKLQWWILIRTTLMVIICNKAVVFIALAFYSLGALSWGIIRNGAIAFFTQNAALIDRGFIALLEMETQVALFAELSDWGGPAITILMTAAAAAWVGREVEENGDRHALVLAVMIALMTPMLDRMIGIDPMGLFRFKGVIVFALTVVAGWVGGSPVHEDLTQAKLMSRTSQAIRSANTMEEVLAALAQNLAGKNITVAALWEVVNRDEMGTPLEFLLLAASVPEQRGRWRNGLRLNSVTELASWKQIQAGKPVLLQYDALSSMEKEVWLSLGIQSMALFPLLSRAGALQQDGGNQRMIVIGSNLHYGISDRQLQNYLAIEAQVSLMLENLQLLQQARQTGVLQERQRLAHEIHDTLAQGFTSIVMHLEAAEQAIPTQKQRVLHHLRLSRQMARDGLEQSRRLVWALRPRPLEEAPLPEALGRVLHKWSRQNRVKGYLHVTGARHALHPDIEVTVLRTMQEALANVQKHAQAKEVNVTVSYLDDLLVVDIQDDGVGFDLETIKSRPSSRQGGFGLPGMARRLTRIQGELTVESEVGEGTTVVLVIPLQTINPEEIISSQK